MKTNKYRVGPEATISDDDVDLDLNPLLQCHVGLAAALAAAAHLNEDRVPLHADQRHSAAMRCDRRIDPRVEYLLHSLADHVGGRNAGPQLFRDSRQPGRQVCPNRRSDLPTGHRPFFLSGFVHNHSVV